jgi:hypothetical protein
VDHPETIFRGSIANRLVAHSFQSVRNLPSGSL